MIYLCIPDAAEEKETNYNIIKTGQLSTVGPIAFVQGGTGVIVRTPLYAQVVDASANFSIPMLSNRSCSVCYDASHQRKFWGFLSALIGTDAISDGSDDRLYDLRNAGYEYVLQRIADDRQPSNIIIGRSNGTLTSPVSFVFAVPGATVRVPSLPVTCSAVYADFEMRAGAKEAMKACYEAAHPPTHP